jgi:hypothetical protein
MQSISPRFGLLSLHTHEGYTSAHLYKNVGAGQIELNGRMIVQYSPSLVKLEQSMRPKEEKTGLLQRVQPLVIKLIQNLSLSDSDES